MKFNKANFFRAGFLLLVLFSVSCKKDGRQGPIGYKSLLDISNEPPGSNCQTGGIKIKSGIDKNNSNILDSAEVDNTKYVCNGLNSELDKQILLIIPGGAGSTSSTNGFIGGELIKFNKTNFANVDSIVLVSRLYVYPTNNTAILELYNRTDNVPIANSQLTSNAFYENAVYQQTGNLYNSLPDKEIHLGVRLRSANEGVYAASASEHYLILYRRK